MPRASLTARFNVLTRLLATSVLLLGLAAPAYAQTEPSPIEIEATIGLDGWIDYSRPVPVEVTIRSDVLFSGIVKLQGGGTTVEIPAEVPAGGEKTYQVMVSPTITDALITVSLVPAGQDESISTLRVQPRRALDSVLVGIVGVDGIALPARTVVGDVAIVEVLIDDVTAGLGPLDYLVAGGGMVVTDHVLEWVADGGRLVVSSNAIAGIDLGDGTVVDEINGVRFEVGRGQVAAVDDLMLEDAAWARSIQPVRSIASESDPWSSAEVQMLRAASNSVPGALASPSILIGLAVYAVLVAPVNLIVLKRMQRRELAWITVPALGVITVLVFLIVGAVRTQSSQFAHAALIVGTPERSEMRSMVVVATSTGRLHRLSVDPDLSIYPAATGDALGLGVLSADRSVTSSTELDLDFREAGYGTAGVIGPAPLLPTVSLDTNEATPVLIVDNKSEFDLTAYGVVTGPFVSVATGVLEAGATGSVRIEADNLGMPSDVVFQFRRDQGNSRWWEIYGSLVSAAQEQAGDHYFFGFVEGVPLPIEVDGRSTEITGPGIVIIPLADFDLDIGRASAQVVAASPDAFVAGEGPWRWIDGEWAILRFDVPTDRDIDLEKNDQMFGGDVVAMEGWDWEAGSFTGLDLGNVDQDRFVDSDGQLIIRVFPEIADEFRMMQFNVASLNVTWDSGPG